MVRRFTNVGSTHRVMGRRDLVKRIRSENESDMEVALVALDGEPLSASTGRARAFDVRTCWVLDLLSGRKLSSSKHVGATWTEALPSLVMLSPMRRSLACGE